MMVTDEILAVWRRHGMRGGYIHVWLHLDVGIGTKGVPVLLGLS